MVKAIYCISISNHEILLDFRLLVHYEEEIAANTLELLRGHIRVSLLVDDFKAK